MYNAHYQFRESPFGVTPDPHFYYSNAAYREAWATLRYGIEGRKGFTLIAGEAGTGKTTLLRKALHEFPPNIKAAYIPNPLDRFTELLRLILRDLGVTSSTDDKFDLMEQLNDYLLEQFNSAHIVAVLIDEAQDLSVECLEELRLLGNLETDKHKLLQIVLVGQPGLERKLNQPELLQLKQRVVLRCRLHPIDASEVGLYIDSRLQTIGRRSDDLFDPEAIDKIAFYSKGFPRLINIICDNALLTAYALSKVKINAAMIEEVADDLRIGESQVRKLAPPRPAEEKTCAPALTKEDNLANGSDRRGSRYLKPLIGTAAACVMLSALGGFLYSQGGGFPRLSASSRIATAVGIGRNQSDQDKLAAQALEPTAHSEAPSVWDQNLLADRLKETTNLAAQQISSGLIAPEKKQVKLLRRDDRRNNGTFFVAGASFVRSQPTSNAEIIATLEPGMRVNVAGRTGEYYRVRSLGTETIRGYVHEQDAFFERN